MAFQLNKKNRQRIDQVRCHSIRYLFSLNVTQLQSKEAKEEADDLQQTAEEAALGDSAYRMRKVG
jgi:hypothetical protein